MVHAAPRQVLFAATVFLVFCLNVLALVLIAEQKTQAQSENAARHIATKLGDELGSALARKDRVSMSVIVARYESSQASYVGVLDSEGQVLVPVGEISGGTRLRQDVIYDGRVLGAVEVEVPEVSRAALLAEFWPLLFAMMLLSLLLFLVYSYVARPTPALIESIETDARNRLLASGLLLDTEHIQQKTPTAATMIANALTDNAPVRIGTEHTIKADFDKSYPSNVDSVKHADFVVRFCFFDPHHLLDALSMQVAENYFALCTQLLHRSVHQVLSSVDMTDIEVLGLNDVDRSGTWLYLAKGSPKANIALAAAAIARLVPMVNEVVYDKHRELGLFALPLRALACDFARCKVADELLYRHRGASFALLSFEYKESVAKHMNLVANPQPKTIYERECYELTEVSDEMAHRLVAWRNQTLLHEEFTD